MKLLSFVPGLKSLVTRLVAQSARRGMYVSYGSWQNRKEFTLQEAVAIGMANSVWLYKAIEFKATSLASVPWIAVDRNMNRVKNHPLEVLINRPNMHMSASDLIHYYSGYMDLAGSAPFEIVRGAGKRPVALYPIRPDYVKPMPDPDLFIKGYKLDDSLMGSQRRDKDTPDLLPEECMWIRYPHPLDPYRGFSPLYALRNTIDSEKAAQQWNVTLLENNAVPGGILSIPGTAIDEDTLEAIKKNAATEFTGENRHRPMVLWGGMTWQSISLKPDDIGVKGLRESNKFEVCAATGVPAALIGANADPTYANYDSSRLSFWEDTQVPRLNMFASAVNRSIAPDFGSDVLITYDLSQVPAMRAVFSEKLKQASVLSDLGYPTNQINQRLGLGMPVNPWQDTAFLPGNLMPVNMLLENPSDAANNQQ